MQHATNITKIIYSPVRVISSKIETGMHEIYSNLLKISYLSRTAKYVHAAHRRYDRCIPAEYRKPCRTVAKGWSKGRKADGSETKYKLAKEVILRSRTVRVKGVIGAWRQSRDYLGHRSLVMSLGTPYTLLPSGRNKGTQRRLH